ncbi:MAG TPA: histidine phosphatase family protein [Dehalococcoidia bacterium]|nr:histidine phosphatase family protein [Dehalococcoidia bacterium]
MTRIVLIRHAETAHNRDGLVQGRADNPLSELGVRQAEALAAALATVPFAAVCSSPLQRALQTARAVAQPHGLDLQVVDALTEMDIGEMEGLTGAELRQRFPEFMRAWLSEHAGDAAMPGGESLQQVQERAGAALDHIVAEQPEATVAVVSHNFVILTLLCRALSLPLNQFRRLRHQVAATSIIDVASDRTALVRLNDTCHLEQAGLLGADPWLARR